MENQRRNTAGWARVIESVQTPLGLLALVVLVCEVVLAVLAARAERQQLTVLLYVMLSILCAVVAVGIYAVARRREVPPQPGEDARVLQEGAHASRTVQEFGTDKSWFAFVEGAENTIEMLGYSMSETLANGMLIRHISKFLEKPHTNFRVLLASPTSPVINQRAKLLGLDTAHLANKIYNAQTAVSRLLDGNFVPGRRDIRAFSTANIPYSLLRVDNKVLVIPYLCTNGKRDSLLITLTADDDHLFKKFTDDFDRFWRNNSHSLYDARINVPPLYASLSSEKGATAEQIANKLTAQPSPGSRGMLKCLDIGCGDGTQSVLLFDQIKALGTWNDVSVTFLDPSPFAVKACEAALVHKRHSFRSPRAVVQKMWQMYKPEDHFDFILCCHVLGTIFHHCGSRDYFKDVFHRMLECLAPKGVLCVVLANERSIELELRQHLCRTSERILSAEYFEGLVNEWKIATFEKHDVRSFLSLKKWLGCGMAKVERDEVEMLNFLFTHSDEITPAVAEPYRQGLLAKARQFQELREEDQQTYIKNIQSDGSPSPGREDPFIEMSHAAFLFRKGVG